MLLRLSGLMSAFLLSVLVSLAAELAPVRYTVRLDDVLNHYVTIEADVPTDGSTQLEVFLPVWTPGSYLVREYAKSIDRVRAFADDGTELDVEKTDKNHWRIATGGRDRLKLRYRLYARDVGIRANWVESDFAFINGSATFITVPNYNRPHEVTVNLPAGWKGVYTPLLPDAVEKNVFHADNYDTLVDSPILAGSPLVDTFEIDGVPHHLVTLGGDDVWDNPRVAQKLAKVAQTQRDFWGAIPYRTPYYFFNLLIGPRSGLEHGNSFVISADRWLSRTDGGINSWLSLASHEFFHAWNVKRLRPVALGPFAYSHENYTKSLWVVEGLTSYYQHLMLLRAGIIKPKDYLGTLSGGIAAVQNIPGRLNQSLQESSFDAWIKAYRSDENSVNANISYYGAGSIAGFLLDAEIRRASKGAKSLDDVMRLAYERYSGARGYTDAEFTAVISEIAGTDFSGWINTTLGKPGNFDYQPALDWYGLAFEPVPTPAQTPDGVRGWLGLGTKNDAGRLVVTQIKADTPAYGSGLSPDDEIIAVNDYRVRPEQLEARAAAYKAGDKISLLVARLDRLMRIEVTLGQNPGNPWKLIVRPDATPEQLERLRAWLGSEAGK